MDANFLVVGKAFQTLAARGVCTSSEQNSDTANTEEEHGQAIKLDFATRP